jgi:PAS domain S-box-containing protein
MDTTDLITSTACASFITDSDGRIVALNEAAEKVLGRNSEELEGRICHEVIRGKDIFGNRFCDGICTIHAMVRRREPVRHFQMVMEHASGKPVQVAMCTLVVRAEDDPKYQVIHMLQPTETLLSQFAASPGGVTPESAGETREGLTGPAHVSGGVLTTREMEVLGLLKDGVPTQSIAESLGISVTTVRNHIQGILRKLGAHSRLEAVSVARRRGII